jgi:hypothetical protein
MTVTASLVPMPHLADATVLAVVWNVIAREKFDAASPLEASGGGKHPTKVGSSRTCAGRVPKSGRAARTNQQIDNPNSIRSRRAE